jgi:mannobiose 2-epimerase
MRGMRRCKVSGWHGPAWLVIGLGGLWVGELAAATLMERGRAFREQLTGQVLPYWYDTTPDNRHGGYRLGDDGQGGGEARDKQLVSQSRMIWAFAHAHRHGYSDERRDYLTAARKGYLFLRAHFLDREHGGYYWKTDLEGKVIHPCKFLYGEAFVIYALVEFHRASGEVAALAQALGLYRVLQRNLHDEARGGWVEHAEADWTPLEPGDSRNEVEVVGYRSANAHLHWMEALSELYDESRDADVRQSLEEALRINREYFYPKDAGRSCFHRQPDWSAVTEARSAGLSYGHNVEFGWLMVRAEEVLGRVPSWDHFEAHLDHALRWGTDTWLGGVYARGSGDEPATDTSKVWWVQAEMMAALADALRHRPEPRYEEALERLTRFLLAYQIDPKDGIWLDTVARDGTPLRPGKAHNWKTAYHDVRAMQKFIETFDGR